MGTTDIIFTKFDQEENVFYANKTEYNKYENDKQHVF